MKNEDEIGTLEEMKEADIWRLIAEGWRAVTFAEQAVDGDFGLEDVASWLDDIESRLDKLGAELLSVSREMADVRVWSHERSEIEDLIFEIVHNARPHVEQANKHYAERDRREAQAQAEAKARSHRPEAVN